MLFRSVMSIDEVYDIREKSSAWQAYVKDKRSCPWVTHEAEMIKKTCIKQARKSWPRDHAQAETPFDRAVQYLNNEGGEGLQELAAPAVEPSTEIRMPVRKAAAPVATDAPVLPDQLKQKNPTKAALLTTPPTTERPATEEIGRAHV